MFFTPQQIAESIKEIGGIHTFHGITFLTCKLINLSVGQMMEVQLDAETKNFMEDHHRLAPNSAFYFQPFKSSNSKKKWVRADYPSSGLQAVNTQTFGTAFLHRPKTRLWGWKNGYVDVLSAKLIKGNRIPAFHLAVWLYREIDWPVETTSSTVIDRFMSEFSISAEEKVSLFNLAIPRTTKNSDVFRKTRASWDELRLLIQPPPDSSPDEGGTLSLLETKGLGPAEKLSLEPAQRLTLITGDNGLGKSFLLEVAWWALTGTWSGRAVYPNLERRSKAEIAFIIKGEHSQPQRSKVLFDWKSLSWPSPAARPTVPGLIVYARVDGSFAVWDPSRGALSTGSDGKSEKTVLSSQEVWDGQLGRIEGLIRDWTKWQNIPGSIQYTNLLEVLKKLSPPDLGELRPGKPVRIPEDARDIPTISHPYGETPIVYASAGVRRIVALAYLIVWAWHEHLVSSRLIGKAPQRRMVILVDELEAHLHPHWQRSILPSLTELGKLLAEELTVQMCIATHSPLVMASSESVFDSHFDKLFHLDLEAGTVTLKEIDYSKFGDVSAWLTSPVFELRHARSSEGESAIEEAKQLQMSKGEIDPVKVAETDAKLRSALSQTDRFWPRWLAFAEKYGVNV